ncbi:hypothetical protein BC938DRAFT_482822 [Jimgerdemannia flammicorona]|uniref:GOLD domain-containing protein n=1 Tax=Jimgerdemannia flammicorona TaxID=994334 RepID=A0A433QD90_9FUNG|nr:hypothetical protein BC938DRAFT_482822 [Jimgerdemannia flammicorona]
MTITFQVSKGGNLDIDFCISNPINHIIQSGMHELMETHSLQAEIPGCYMYCFSNQMSAMTDKSVSFNIYGLKHVEDTSEHIDPLKCKIHELVDSMSSVKDE